MFEKILVPNGYELTLATHSHVAEIKSLDDQAFASQEGISVEDLETILENGFIILLRDSLTGSLIGESQVLTNAVPFLDYQIPEGMAFYYGTGIRTDMQGKGLGRLLAAAQDEVSQMRNKHGSLLTIRPENYESLKLRFSVNFVVVDYLPEFYGKPKENGARLLLKKHFGFEKLAYDNTIRVPVSFGSTPDLSATPLPLHTRRHLSGDVDNDPRPRSWSNREYFRASAHGRRADSSPSKLAARPT